ncbi:hypothetical protein GCM10010205_69240 [Streptomyces nojiriensis]|nr:hypothetical protein GCM10010205_69240 [Streptomyces nojiriensis]
MRGGGGAMGRLAAAAFLTDAAGCPARPSSRFGQGRTVALASAAAAAAAGPKIPGSTCHPHDGSIVCHTV